jgi:hypothetical protein
MAARNLENMDEAEREAKVAALKPAWAQEYIRKLEGEAAGHAEYIGRLERVAVDLHRQIASLGGGQAPPAPRVPGMAPPEGEFAVVRVLDGAANMEPIGDLPDRAEIRFTDFYQVHYGSHEITGGMRVLVIEGDGPIQIRSVSPSVILVARGGQDQR